MMKKFMTAAAAAVLALTMSTTAFASWEQDAYGNWRYMTGKDTWLSNTYTNDGYWVDVNGYWDGNASIGVKQADGTFREYGVRGCQPGTGCPGTPDLQERGPGPGQ